VSRVANRYAKALFEAAREENKIDAVRNDIDLITSVLGESDPFNELIYNPLIPAGRKAQAVRRTFGNLLDQLTFNFLLLLCMKKRSEHLPEIMRKFNEMLLDYQGVITGSVVSPQPLPQDQLDSIQKKISTETGKEVRITQETDPDLLGGFVIKIKDTVIDLSVINQLNKLRSKMVHG
jgi:F-type H+-transporting ATPase subunit delta